MGIMDKFATVEIKADRRISEEDRAFCQRQQEAFEKSGVALQKLADLMATVVAEQKAIFADNEEEIGGYLASRNAVTCDVDRVYEVMKHRNKRFIDNIVHYFVRKYRVDLDEGIIREHLIPAKPKEPDFPSVGYYRDMTAEELDDYKAKMKVHQEKQDAWELSLRALPLRYEQIVDEIFVQLGGFSFEERAMNEFLQRTWDACHYTCDYSWNNIKKDDERFEIKNATLRLPDGCNCDENKWMSHPIPKFSPTERLVTLLDALAWYQCGRMSEGHLWFPELGYRYGSTEENVVYTRNMSKVDSIKLFKNGRVDIKFRSAAYAQEFAEQCLRRRTITPAN